MVAQPAPTVETLAVKIIELEKRLDERAAAQRAALEEAKEATRLWQASANEWRATLNDFTGKLMGRQEFEYRHEGLVDEVSELRRSLEGSTGRLATLEGQGSRSRSDVANYLLVFGVGVSVLIAAASLIIHFVR